MESKYESGSNRAEWNEERMRKIVRELEIETEFWNKYWLQYIFWCNLH